MLEKYLEENIRKEIPNVTRVEFGKLNDGFVFVTIESHVEDGSYGREHNLYAADMEELAIVVKAFLSGFEWGRTYTYYEMEVK